MKYKKLIASFTMIQIFLLIFFSLTCHAVSADEDQSFISNDYLKLVVEHDASKQLEYLRFQLETNLGEEHNSNDDNRSMLYKNFFSGYTTININGELFIYGTGTDTMSPYFDIENYQHVSAQQFNGVEVEQRLCFDKGFSDLHNDMLKITYTVKNNIEDANVGIRIMIDPMLDDDDSGYLKTNDVTFTNEVTFLDSNIPDVWSLESTVYPEMHAYGKIHSGYIPDKLIFGQWSSLYDNRWDYNVDDNQNNGDSAVAFLWNEKTIRMGESNTYTAYYGVKNYSSLSPATGTTNNTIYISVIMSVSGIFTVALAIIILRKCRYE